MGFKYFYIETKEWLTSEEVQKRLDEGFNFKCNDCRRSVGDHLKVLADGIFCVDCFNKIMGVIKE